MKTETNTQEEAKRIWDTLDAEDGGQSTVVDDDAHTEPELSAAAQATAGAGETVTGQASSGDESEDEDPKLLREKLLGMEAIVGQLQQRLRNAEGHIGGLSSQLKQQLDVAKKVQAAGGDAPTVAQIKEAQENPEAFKSLERDYPEFAAALAPAVDAKVKSHMNEFRKELESLREHSQRPQGPNPMEEIQRMRSEMLVEVRHPGWQETVRKPEFAGWLQQQNREVQMLAASAEPADAVRLLDIYSDTRRTQTGIRNQRLNAAAALPSGRASVRTKSTDQMSPEEYWTYLDQLERQKG